MLKTVKNSILLCANVLCTVRVLRAMAERQRVESQREAVELVDSISVAEYPPRSAGRPLSLSGKSGVVSQTLRMPHAVGADVATVRVRHFTSVGNLSKIQEGNILLAGDQGRVFAVSARGKPPSPRDVEKALGIARGRGNACVDFDAAPEEFELRVNVLTGAREFVFQGDIDLTHRKAHFSRNR